MNVTVTLTGLPGRSRDEGLALTLSEAAGQLLVLRPEEGTDTAVPDR